MKEGRSRNARSRRAEKELSARVGDTEELSARASETEVFPIFLLLRDKRVVVIGGGEIGTRKAKELLAAGADVLVVAKDASKELAALAKQRQIRLVRRPFRARDLDGAWFVVAATGDAAVNRRVSRAAATRRVFVCAVDDKAHADAYFGGVVRRPPFVVAISSSGELPALTRLVRELVLSVLPDERAVSKARELRASWKASGAPMESRFAALVRELAGHGPPSR